MNPPPPVTAIRSLLMSRSSLRRKGRGSRRDGPFVDLLEAVNVAVPGVQARNSLDRPFGVLAPFAFVVVQLVRRGGELPRVRLDRASAAGVGDVLGEPPV